MKISVNISLLCVTALLIAAMFRSPWPLSSQDAADVTGLESARQQPQRGERESATVDVLPPRPWEVEYELPEKKLPPLTAERIAVCLEVAKDLDEQLEARLRAVYEKDPRRVAMKLQGLRRLRSLAEVKMHDPHLYELRLIEHKTDANVLHLAREVREARRQGPPSEAEALERQLLSQVRLQVGFHFKARDEYLCELKEYVAELESQLEEERRNLERVVEARMRELLQDPDR